MPALIDVVVIAVVVVAVAACVVHAWRSACSGGCDGCGSKGSCHAAGVRGGEHHCAAVGDMLEHASKACCDHKTSQS